MGPSVYRGTLSANVTPAPRIFGDGETASRPVLTKTAAGEIVISFHEYEKLKETTRVQIQFVYDKIRDATDSYTRIRRALNFLGVGLEYEKGGSTGPEDLLADWIDKRKRLLFNWYQSNPFTEEERKKQACRCLWGLDELKAIAAGWIQGKDEDRLLELGRILMAIDDERNQATRKADESRKDRVKREREAAKHKEKVEQQSTEERSRQRAEKNRNVEKQEWASAWARYCRAWKALETDKTKATPSRIPWPVKSGNIKDVNTASVREFFCKAVPVHLAGKAMFRMLSNEIMRWHTNNITFRFGPGVLGGEYRDALEVIAKFLIELRNEAKIHREK